MLSCISFDSYIKPQPERNIINVTTVVYLLIPTSNHNLTNTYDDKHLVVYLLIPTSNHNEHTVSAVDAYVVYLLIPTSNHNIEYIVKYGKMLYIF